MGDTSHDKHEPHPAISRRNILILGGVALVTAALPLAFPRFEPDSHTLVDALAGLLVDRDAAARLGREWRLKSTGAREPRVIAASIGKRLVPYGWRKDGTPDELRTALLARIRHDFEVSDMVGISGWQLARTSAELCALAASLADEGKHDAA
ncbi:MAG: hypothetical protein Q7T44_03930 [Parvibaculum sp.]|nr:hypothetical protein [Parvibaculum sp.]